MVTFTTNQGLAYQISEEGLNKISYGGTDYATGGLYLWDAKNFHGLNSSQSFHSEPFAFNKTNPVNNTTFYTTVKDTISSKTITQLNSTGVLVTHNHANSVVVKYLYHFINPHLNVQVEVTNSSDTAQITCPAVGGLFATFSQSPSGIDYRYTVDDTFNKLNPSNYTRTYCAYLKDETWGIGFHGLNIKNERSLPHFDYGNTATTRVLEHHLRRTIWPQSRETWKLNVCALIGASMSGLLSQYKTDLITQYDGLNYTLDNSKWILKEEISNSGSTNPYRLKNGARLDIAANTATYASGLISILGSGGRGVCIVDMGGYKERNSLSYHLWPRLIEDNVYQFNDIINSGNKEVGIYSDFHFENVRESWTQDTFVPLWPGKNSNMDYIYEGHNLNWIKYKLYKLQDYEFDMFYSPNSGKCYECGLMAPVLREILPSQSIYYGQGIDWAASSVGFHTVANYSGIWTTETPSWFFDLMKYVYGEIDVYAELGSVVGSPSTDFYTYALQNRMSCWISNTGQIPQVNSVQSGYVDTTLGLFYDPLLAYNFNYVGVSSATQTRNFTGKNTAIHLTPSVVGSNAVASGYFNCQFQSLTQSITSIAFQTSASYLLFVTTSGYINISSYMDVTIRQVNNSGVSIQQRVPVIFDGTSSIGPITTTVQGATLSGSGSLNLNELALSSGVIGRIGKVDVNVFMMASGKASVGTAYASFLDGDLVSYY